MPQHVHEQPLGPAWACSSLQKFGLLGGKQVLRLWSQPASPDCPPCLGAYGGSHALPAPLGGRLAKGKQRPAQFEQGFLLSGLLKGPALPLGRVPEAQTMALYPSVCVDISLRQGQQAFPTKVACRKHMACVIAWPRGQPNWSLRAFTVALLSSPALSAHRQPRVQRPIHAPALPFKVLCGLKHMAAFSGPHLFSLPRGPTAAV